MKLLRFKVAIRVEIIVFVLLMDSSVNRVFTQKVAAHTTVTHTD